MHRRSGVRALRARLAFLCLVAAVPGCGNDDVRGEWSGVSPELGSVTLMLDLDGHFELTLAAPATVGDTAADSVAAARSLASAARNVTYSGRYEAAGDTIHLRGIPGEYYLLRSESELMLAARGSTIRLRRS